HRFLAGWEQAAGQLVQLRVRGAQAGQGHSDTPRTGSGASDEILVHVGAVEVRPPDRPRGAAGPVDVLAVDRYPVRGAGQSDEALIHAGAIEVRPPDRGRGRRVAPVDVLAVDRHRIRRVDTGDEILV